MDKDSVVMRNMKETRCRYVRGSLKLLAGFTDLIDRKLRDPVVAVAARAYEIGGAEMHAEKQSSRPSQFRGSIIDYLGY